MKRRTFIISSVTLTGGLVIGGYSLSNSSPELNPLNATLTKDQVSITPYVIIEKSGVSIIAPRAEMGQGIQGTLAALVAEELDILVTDVQVIHGQPSHYYANNIAYKPESKRKQKARALGQKLGVEFYTPRHPQLTGGQSSIRDAFVKMRKAGAAARTVLVEAASKKWGINVDQLKTKNGKVFHPNGQAITYTDLIDFAREISPPDNPVLKPRKDWKQLGKSQPRVDMTEKCTGTAVYSIDIRQPDMLFATVLLNPFIGGGIKEFDLAEAEASQGVKKIIILQDGFVVVATNTWYAMNASKNIKVIWNKPPYPESTEDHRRAIVRALEENSGKILRNEGDVDQSFEEEEVIKGDYYVPYLAHATMEPMNAAAWLRNGKLELWAGNQNPGKAQYLASKIAGISPNDVTVHTTYMGGGFGRRLENDFINIAVQTAVAMEGIPVRVTWSRESDMTHDVYRPTAIARFEGTVLNGSIQSLALDLCSPSLFSSSKRRNKGTGNDIAERLDKFSTAGAVEQPYSIPNYRVIAHESEQLLPVGWWRGVGESQNVFFHDSAIDELAFAAGVDPLKMRLSLVNHEPSRTVLEAVAKMSNWESELGENRARGVAYALSSEAATAQVIQVYQTENGILIEKIFAAIDVGIALDPRNIIAQIESSIIFGLCAAMHGEITVTDGKVDQTNFHNYSILRMGQAPQIEVEIVESGERIFGVGESGTPTAPPALGNAIFALTGQRIRQLPFSGSVKFAWI